MDGLNFKTLIAIEKQVNRLFDVVVSSFLGNIPDEKKKRQVLFTPNTQNIGNLFIEGIGNRVPNKEERDAFKVMVSKANSYVQGLKARTKARIAVKMDSSIKRGDTVSEIKKLLESEFKTAENQLKLIVNAESTGVRNSSTAIQIKRKAKDHGVEDPDVYYDVVYDDRTAEKPEKNLHLVEGTQIPRVWKLSQLSGDYWRKGMEVPSIHGGHPNCRCILMYLPKGYGFDKKGRIKYISKTHDEYEYQKEKYPLSA